MLEITPRITAQGGTLEGRFEGTLVGHIDFVPSGPDFIDLYHTKVFPEFEGRGFGRQLVAAAADYARTEGLQLKASCSYAAQVLSRMQPS